MADNIQVSGHEWDLLMSMVRELGVKLDENGKLLTDLRMTHQNHESRLSAMERKCSEAQALHQSQETKTQDFKRAMLIALVPVLATNLLGLIAGLSLIWSRFSHMGVTP